MKRLTQKNDIVYNNLIYAYPNKRIKGVNKIKNIEDILKALADETRLRIINLLYEKEELCVCDLYEALKITQTKASRHLQYLKNAGLVDDRKHAQWIYYSIKKNEQMKFIDNLVYNNLRNIELYKNDLESLTEWLKQKNILCDR